MRRGYRLSYRTSRNHTGSTASLRVWLVPSIEVRTRTSRLLRGEAGLIVLECAETGAVEALEPVRQRYNAQHYNLRKFYYECSNLKFLTNLITVPKLPRVSLLLPFVWLSNVQLANALICFRTRLICKRWTSRTCLLGQRRLNPSLHLLPGATRPRVRISLSKRVC